MNKQDSTDGAYYTDHDLVVLLGISVGRLRNKLCAGSPLRTSKKISTLAMPS